MEFPDLGKHCSWSLCRQLDFLPFTCAYCHKAFCLDHRLPGEHECESHKKPLDLRVAICPLCEVSIKYTENEDIHRLMDTHFGSVDCKRKAKERRHKKKCLVARCNAPQHVLFPCKSCEKLVCVTHRFPSDHACSQALNHNNNNNNNAGWFSFLWPNSASNSIALPQTTSETSRKLSSSVSSASFPSSSSSSSSSTSSSSSSSPFVSSEGEKKSLGLTSKQNKNLNSKRKRLKAELADMRREAKEKADSRNTSVNLNQQRNNTLSQDTNSNNNNHSNNSDNNNNNRNNNQQATDLQQQDEKDEKNEKSTNEVANGVLSYLPQSCLIS